MRVGEKSRRLLQDKADSACFPYTTVRRNSASIPDLFYTNYYATLEQ
jgi:hypothetical protein